MNTEILPAPPGGGAAALLLRPLTTMLDALHRINYWTLVLLVTLMVVLVFAQVVARYLLNSSIDWADELSRLAFVWSIFLAIAMAIREHLHIGMVMLTERLPEAYRVMLARLMDGIAAGMMCIVCYESAVLAFDQWDEKLSSMNGSAAWFVMAIVVGAALSALELVRLAILGQSPSGEGAIE
ncbi:TRAP transporter small permease [Uliginosibacterium sp. H3]|uniref:TRAP transporter small permease protein n=1 Tax=Uliginosibacterium silvisoli TaxID=3114758 RepID=A0ABU6K3E3_9RHOO|nr:TRAP transporter small permease [Uliginosibacterium sp. H3]